MKLQLLPALIAGGEHENAHGQRREETLYHLWGVEWSEL
jgi:hypothetical protein